MRISQMSTLSGASPRSLRHYEDVGLLRPSRSASGQRHYQLHDVDRAVTIQHLLAAGLSTAAIRDVLPCLDAAAAERTGYLEQRLSIEAHRIGERRKELTRQLDVLNDLLNTSPRK